MLFTLLLRVLIALVARWRHWSPPRLTAVLLAAFIVHHPVWRWTTEHWSTWWPSHRTTALGWIAIALGYVALILANRLVIRHWPDTARTPHHSAETDVSPRAKKLDPAPDSFSALGFMTPSTGAVPHQ
jgi:hypothetical protein